MKRPSSGGRYIRTANGKLVKQKDAEPVKETKKTTKKDNEPKEEN